LQVAEQEPKLLQLDHSGSETTKNLF